MHPEPNQGHRALIWDLPVRVFHWLFALTITGALLIVFAGPDESPTFGWHAVLGLTAAAMAAWRVVWGWLGTRYARFGAMRYGPSAIIGYFAGVVAGRDTRHVGHNPGSVVAIGLMVLCALALAATGLALGLGNEGIKEAHEILAWGMLAAVGLHLAGLAVHTIRFRENIAASMVHGYKVATAESAIGSPRTAAGVGLLVAAVACLMLLSAGLGSTGTTLRLPGLGATLRIGDADHGEHEPGEASERDDD